MKNILFTIFLSSIFFSAMAQKADESSWGIKFSGYVNMTGIYDSRQTVAAREGHFFIYPKPELPDVTGKDLNAVPNYNMAAIQTRLTGKITGPDFLGAKTNGVIESEFMGNSDSDVNGLRIRHAYVNFTWGNTSLLLGQTWSPFFIPEDYPDQIGSNASVPFQPFGRNPQIKLTQQIDNFKISATLTSQRDYTSTGPNGSSSEYLRNAAMPGMHLQLQLKAGAHVFGGGAEYMKLRPALKSVKNYYTDETVSSYGFLGYAKLVFDKLTFKLEGTYGANLFDLTMIGGYAVKSVDTATKIEKYTPIKVYSVWSELVYGKELEFGIFAGYTKNLGSVDENTGIYYAREKNTIDDIMRIAPRVQFTNGKTKFCFEVEYTQAGFGNPDIKGEIKSAKKVANTRVYFATYYYF
jgi:hypothetical protein